MPYDRVTVNIEKEEVSLERTRLDPRLISTTTGGMEASCRDCLLPFGLVLTVIGLSATSVACVNDPPGSVLSILGWVLLGTGVLGVAVSCAWQQWRTRKRSGSWTILESETDTKKPVV